MAFVNVVLSIMLLIIGFILICFVYTMYVTYKQTKVFINNLQVGDKTNFGKISELDGDYVIINREPLKIHRSDIQPVEFKANKFFFLLKK